MAAGSVSMAFNLFVIAASSTAPGCPGNATAVEVMQGSDLRGKVAIVTGGDSGLGFGMAESLAKLGVHVVIAARNMTKGAAAAKNITAATGATLDVLSLDLISKASVRAFADEFLSKYNSLHFLINNAGIASPSFKTADGFESVFEVDYLGHFLLTELLLPTLRSSRPSRVVNVASAGHEVACRGACLPENCFKDWTYIPTPVVSNCTPPVFTPGPTYGAAKLFNIMHAKALAQRETRNGVKAFSINPGFVLTPATGGFDPQAPGSKFACMAQAHPPSLPPQNCPFNEEQGAAVIGYAATAADVVPGTYYDRKLACQEGKVITHGFTDAMIPELYERSLGWAGLKDVDVVV